MWIYQMKRSPEPSPVVSKWLGFGLLLSSLQPADSFVSISRMRSALAYGFTMDLSQSPPKVLTAGTDYDTDYHKATQNGQANTECYVGIGDANDFDRITFESPNVCLDIASLGEQSEGFPDAVVTGMAGQTPMIISVKYGKNDVATSELVDAALLLDHYFPAKMTTDASANVYVALHPTHGAIIAPPPRDMSDLDRQVEELRSTWLFLEEMTRPAPTMVEDANATAVDYSPKIVKYNLGTKDQEWIHPLDTLDGKSVVTGMAISEVRNKLVFVGSATGTGPGIGANAVGGGDWDGFLTVLDMDDGDLDTNNWNLTYNAPHSTRIRSQKDMDDEVLSVCVAGDKAYVVGATQGLMEGDSAGGGFAMMYDIDTLAPTWVKQFGQLGMLATHCVVRGESLYVGGTVLENIKQVVAGGMPNHDIFVAKFNAYNGQMQYLKQIDSLRDDELIGMYLNPLISNVILSANARDFKKGSNVIYTMDVDSDGNYDWENLPDNIDPITGESLDVWTVPPVVSDAPDGNTGNNSNSTSPPRGENANDAVIATAVTVPALILLFISCYYFCNSSRQVPLDYPDDPTHGNAAEDTELQMAPTDTGDDRSMV